MPQSSDRFRFEVVSDDPDTYTLRFAPDDDLHPSLYQLLSDAIAFRVSDLTSKNTQAVRAMSTKIDAFSADLFGGGQVEMDVLHQSVHMVSFDVYAYDSLNRLKGKASCCIHFDSSGNP